MDGKEINQSILKKISPEYSLEELIPKLKLQYFSNLMQRADKLEKTDAWKDRRQKEKGVAEDEIIGWHRQLSGCESEQIQERVKVRRAWHGVTELSTA